MFVQLLFVTFCLCQEAILAVPYPKPVYDTEDFGIIGRHFETYLRTHNKNYDEAEKIQRFVNFIANVKNINELNRLYDETLFDLNHLTDWSEEELKSLRGLRVPKDGGKDGLCKVVEQDPTSKDAPAALDWRTKGAVSPVKAQGACGSCWAFSATGVVESRSLQQGKDLILSEQQLVDCDTQSEGCGGGLMSFGLSYLIESGGQELSEDYPYNAAQGACQFDKSKAQAQVLNCTDYTLSSEDALKELLFKEGPLAIAVSATKGWLGYQGGLWTDCGDKSLNHGVLLVGYGAENGVDFWLIKNSWGAGWGEQGFIRLQRGVGCNGIGGIGFTSPFPAITSAVLA